MMKSVLLSLLIVQISGLRLRQSKLAISSSQPVVDAGKNMRFQKREIDHELTAKANGCPHVNGTICADRGSCVEGSCMCKSGFFGVACESIHCPKSCSKNGFCDETKGECTFVSLSARLFFFVFQQQLKISNRHVSGWIYWRCM